MKSKMALALIFLCLSLAATSAAAQSGGQACGGLNGGTIAACPSTCGTGSYISQPSQGTQRCWVILYLRCGSCLLFPTWVQTTTPCPCRNVGLQTPQVRARIEFLTSKGVGLMLLDCTGHLVRYVPDSKSPA